MRRRTQENQGVEQAHKAEGPEKLRHRHPQQGVEVGKAGEQAQGDAEELQQTQSGGAAEEAAAEVPTQGVLGGRPGGPAHETQAQGHLSPGAVIDGVAQNAHPQAEAGAARHPLQHRHGDGGHREEQGARPRPGEAVEDVELQPPHRQQGQSVKKPF